MTQTGSAHLDVTASTAKALATLKELGAQATTILKPLTNVELKVKTTIQKPKAADLRAVLAGVTGTVKVDVAVKPLTQKALNAALAAVKGEKTVKITVDSQDAATRIAAIRTLLTNLGTTVRNLFNINTTGLNVVLTAGNAMLAKFAVVITDLRALIVQLNASGGRQNGPPGGGSGGAGGGVGSYAAQLRLLQADLKSGALNTAQFDTATKALKATIDAEIASLRGLGVLTADQQKRLDALRISSGQAGAALKGLGTGPAASVAQLGRELDIANSRFQRGDITLREYLREQQRITAAGAALRGSLAAGSTEAKNLEQVFGRLRTASQGINAKSIDQVKLSLSQARAAFDQASAAASTFAQRRNAIVDYQRSVQQLEQRIASLGQRTNLTALQTKQLADLQARLAREQATLQGSNNPLGLGANVLNALRAAFPLVQQVGGSLGAAASTAGQFGGGLSGIAEKLGPVGIAIGVATLAVAGLTLALSKTIGTAAQYQQTFADITALTRDASQPVSAFTDTLVKLQQATIDIGKPLGVGANQAATAILELNKAGLSAADTIGGGLKGALDLAGASGETAADGAKIAVAAMTAFGLQAKDLPAVADVFANFANKTFLGAQDLSIGIAAVGPVAKDAGLDLKQLGGVMATLAQGGFRNMSDAGTSLKTLLLSLEAPTDTAAKYLKALNVSAFDASGSMRPLSSVMGDLREQLIKLTPQAQKEVLKQIFGTDAIRAAQVLLTAGPAALNANTEAMGKTGEAARVAKERLNSYEGAQRQLKASVEELTIKIGSRFLPILTGMVKGLDGTVGAIQNFRLNLAPIAGYVGPVIVAMLAFRASVIATATASAWTTLFGFLTSLPVQLAAARGALLAFAAANPIGIIATVAAGVTAYANKIISDTQAAYDAINQSSNQAYQKTLNRVQQLSAAGDALSKAKAKYLLAQQQLGEAETGTVTGTNFFTGEQIVKVDQAQLEAARARLALRKQELDLAQKTAAAQAKVKPPPLPKPPPPVKPGATFSQAPVLPSGTGTLAGLGLGPTTKRAPVTAQDLADLNTFKASLKSMTDEELRAAQASALASNNKRQESAILAELNRRQKESIKAVQTTGIALSDYKAALRGKSDAQLADLEASTRAAKNNSAHAAVLAELARRTRSATSESRASAAQATRDAATRATLVREIRQSVESFKLLSDQGKVTAASQLAFNHRIEDFRARIAKLPPELQRGTEALISQAQQLSKNAALHVAAARKVKDQADTARTLTTQLTQLNDRFRLQAAEGKVTADSLLAYQQRLETLGNQVAKLPAPLQGVLGSLLAQGQGLATAGQRAVAYSTEIGKLKEAVKNYTFAELEAARARVVASGGDAKKLALIDAEIKKYKTLTTAQVEQADADSQLAQRSTDTSGLEGQRDNAIAGAKGNLAEIYRLQLEYGTRIQAAQDAQARAQAAKDVLDVNDKYAKLLSLAGITAEQRTRLEQDQAAEVLAINTGLTNALAKNDSDRLATEEQARQALNDRLRTMDRESRDTIRKDVLDGFQRDTVALEAQQQSELDVEDLTEAQKLAIRQRYQPLLLAQKAKEVQASREIDLQAETDRYADALDAAARDGTLTAQLAQLDEVHRQERARINRQYDDEERDYSLGVKRDTGKQLVAAQKETSAGLLEEAKGHVSDILDGLDTTEAAQRESARNTLTFWRATYVAMGLAGKVAVDEIDAAIRKLDLAGQKARADAGKLVEGDLSGLQSRGASDLAAVGKPDDAAGASAKAASQFDSLRDTYQKKLDELRVALGQFADVRDADLTPDQRQVRDGLLGTQEAYQGLLDNVTLTAAQAGDAAATAFTDAQKDAAAEAALNLVEAQKALADVEGKDGSPAYIAGLNAALAYWRARLLGLTTGTPEYLAALQKITDLETKVQATKATGGLASAFKDASGIVGKANALSAGVSSALDGLGAYFEAGGSSGGKKSILLGAAAFVSGLAAVFTTGDEDMDKVTNTFVNGVTTVLSKLATGDTVGAIIAGAATVISTIVNIFSGGANSIKKAKDNIASATKDVKLFDVSKYAKVVSVGGFFGWLGFKKAEIDQESIDIAKNLGDALYEAISGGMLDGIKAGKASFGELGIDIKKSLSQQILQGLIDGFLKSAVFQATIQPFLDKYIAAMKSGNKQALVEAASDLSGAIDRGSGQLEQFYNDVLVPTGKKLGVFGSDASSDTASSSTGLSQSAGSDLGLIGTLPAPVVQAVSDQALSATVTTLSRTVDDLQSAVETLTQRGIPLDIALSRQAESVRYQSTTGSLRNL